MTRENNLESPEHSAGSPAGLQMPQQSVASSRPAGKPAPSQATHSTAVETDLTPPSAPAFLPLPSWCLGVLGGRFCPFCPKQPAPFLRVPTFFIATSHPQQKPKLRIIDSKKELTAHYPSKGAGPVCVPQNHQSSTLNHQFLCPTTRAVSETSHFFYRNHQPLTK